MQNSRNIMQKAYEKKVVIPAFNVAFLPMMKPITEAVKDSGSFALIQVAKLEWEKFGAGGLKAIAGEYHRLDPKDCTRLHLDHIPVLDEDHMLVDYMYYIKEAIALGFQSVMVDGSRLSLMENVKATQKVVEYAHALGIPVEAELGAILGHERGPLPPYEELFKSKKGFTDPDDALTFVNLTDVDWISIAIGNIHGDISENSFKQSKTVARLDIDHVRKINAMLGIPIVLHGGSGIENSYIQEGIRNGIAKINIGTNLRKPYQLFIVESKEKALQAVYDATLQSITRTGYCGFRITVGSFLTDTWNFQTHSRWLSTSNLLERVFLNDLYRKYNLIIE